MVHCVVLLCFLVSVAYNGAFPDNHGLLNAIKEIGDAAIDLMDDETRVSFYIAQKRVTSLVKKDRLDNEQLSAAMNLVRFISRKMKEGRIRLDHIKHFIDFALSDRLAMLLSTWDIDLLKKT